MQKNNLIKWIDTSISNLYNTSENIAYLKILMQQLEKRIVSITTIIEIKS